MKQMLTNAKGHLSNLQVKSGENSAGRSPSSQVNVSYENIHVAEKSPFHQFAATNKDKLYTICVKAVPEHPESSFNFLSMYRLNHW